MISYPRIAAIIRFASVYTAHKCTELGEDALGQFLIATKELLAFFSSIACNEICTRGDSAPQNAVTKCYDSIVEGLAKPAAWPELEVGEEVQISILVILGESKPSFSAYFFAYWNGKLESLGISKANIDELAALGIKPPDPKHGVTGNSAYAVLARVGRTATKTGKNPPALLLYAYDKIIGEGVQDFLQALRFELDNQKL